MALSMLDALRRCGAPASSSRRCTSVPVPHPASLRHQTPRSLHQPRQPCMRMRAASTDLVDGTPADDDEELEEQVQHGDQEDAQASADEVLARWKEMWNTEMYNNDNSFALQNPYNQEPDMFDPEWHTKVTDWYEFWNHQKWDYEIEGVDDEEDVGGNPVSSRQRITRLIEAIKDNRTRTDVMNFVGTHDVLEHIGTWELPPVVPERTPLNPDYSFCDLRAIAEKKARKEMMDGEWRRRQDQLVGRLTYPDPYKDVRFEHFGKTFSDLKWSKQRINHLITIGGTAAKPEDHGALVQNPLVPIDYVQTMGVHHVEDTEDFLESIGHLATPDDEEDLFESEYVFEDALGMLGLGRDPSTAEVEDEEEGEWGPGGELEGVVEEEDGDGY